MHNNRNNYIYQDQLPRKNPIRGILIYEQARRKLNISPDGKLYRQKWFSYLPIFGPIFSLVYSQYCLGKVKCLRNKDELLFRGARKSTKLFAYLLWPLLFLGIWTVLSCIIADFSVISANQNTLLNGTYKVGQVGSYSWIWQNVFFNAVTNSSDFGTGIANFFGGLFSIFIFPLLAGTYFQIGDFQIGCNIVFIIVLVIITMINPVNIFNLFAINRPILRFTIVYESSSIYRYRASH